MSEPFFIISELNGLALEVEKASKSARALLVMNVLLGFPNQQFRLDGQTICNLNSGMVLDVKGSAKHGNVVQQYPKHGGENQRWTMHNDGTITVANTNLALDISSGNKNVGANVIVWKKHGSANQKWKFQYVHLSPFKNITVTSPSNNHPQNLNMYPLVLTNSNSNSKMETTTQQEELEKLRKEVQILKEENRHLKEENSNLSKTAIVDVKNIELLSYEQLESEEVRYESLLNIIRKQKRELRVCPICLENASNTFFNCGHMTCNVCSVSLSLCPKCRQPIVAKNRIYA